MVKIVPIYPATATAQQMVVEVTVDLCRRECVNGEGVLSGTAVYVAGAVREVDGVAVVPVTVSGEVVTTGRGGCAKTRHYVETFDVAFTGTATNDVTLTAGDAVVAEYANVCCCHASKVRLLSVLTAEIA